jgi:hypothetical protein
MAANYEDKISAYNQPSEEAVLTSIAKNIANLTAAELNIT